MLVACEKKVPTQQTINKKGEVTIGGDGKVFVAPQFLPDEIDLAPGDRDSVAVHYQGTVEWFGLRGADTLASFQMAPDSNTVYLQAFKSGGKAYFIMRLVEDTTKMGQLLINVVAPPDSVPRDTTKPALTGKLSVQVTPNIARIDTSRGSGRAPLRIGSFSNAVLAIGSYILHFEA
ncbi:MAG: hypothetical protein ABIJ91_05285, partial [Candidatus Kuenenbacteria bacterium]